MGEQWTPELNTGKRLTAATFQVEVPTETLGTFIDNGRNSLYVDGRLSWDEQQKQLVYLIA